MGTGQGRTEHLPSTLFPSLSIATNAVYLDTMLPFRLTSITFWRIGWTLEKLDLEKYVSSVKTKS